jgi:DNA-binding phage protein
LLDQEDDGRPAWFLAAKGRNVKLLQDLWDSAREKGNSEETISKFLLAQNQDRETALHLAATGSVEAMKKLWAFGKEAQLKGDELYYKLLLTKDKY